MPFLHQDSTGKYPVLLTNSGHTGVKNVRFHYSLKAIYGTEGSNNLRMRIGPSFSDKESIKIRAEEMIPYNLNLNSRIFKENKFSFDHNIVHIDFAYVRITYRRVLDNKFFYTEKVYIIPANGDMTRLSEAEWSDYFIPSEGVLRGVQNMILVLLQN